MTEEEAITHLWDWSLEIYGQPGVKDALLTLQDRYGYNVNVVLWSLWTAEQGWDFSSQEVAALTTEVADFHRYGVERLREVRRYVSAPKPGFRTTDLRDYRALVLDLELAGERLIQRRLVAATYVLVGPPPMARPAMVHKVARRHFQGCGMHLEKPDIIADGRGPRAQEVLFDTLLTASPSKGGVISSEGANVREN